MSVVTSKTGTPQRVVPDLQPNRQLVLPPSAERHLANGLTVIAVERRSVPLIELRLRIPFGRTSLDPQFVARSALLSQTMFSGSAKMSNVEIDEHLQAVGATLSAGVDPDRLLVSGSCLASGLERVLAILADVLATATYPEEEVATERARMIDRIQVALSQPSHLARTTMLRRVYGEHPYAMQTPEISDLVGLGSERLRPMHSARIHPDAATVVVVGDLPAQAMLDRVEAALGSWTAGGSGEGGVGVPPVPPLVAGPLVLADRPGSVQSSLRLAMTAVDRIHPDHAALQLANLIFGGYFSSRWVENIREDKGFSYAPHAIVDHSLAGSLLIISTEVATSATAAALLETWYELGRMATSGPSPQELEQARQYALGSLLLGLSTQSGLAGLASTYAGAGLRLDYLAGYASRLSATTLDEVSAAAARYLAPTRAVTVVLGDAAAVADQLGALAPLERVALPANAGPGEDPNGDTVSTMDAVAASRW